MVEETSKTANRARGLERIRHVAWAGLIALVLHVATLLEPIDQTFWVLQSRLASQPASGEIVFVGSTTNLSDPDEPLGRVQLAKFVDRLDAAGATSVFIDMPFERPSNPGSDARLRASLQSFSGEAFMVRLVRTGLDGQRRLVANDPAIVEGTPQVANDTWMNFLGFTWTLPYQIRSDGQSFPSLASQLASDIEIEGNEFPVSYVFSRSSIPTYRFADLQNPNANLSAFAGKQVVIGDASLENSAGRKIPGHVAVPPSIISIYGAETLKAGYTKNINGLLVLIAACAALLLASTLSTPRLRYTGYAVIACAIPTALIATAVVAMRINVADSLALILIFALYRTRSSMRRTLRLVDADTKLPTFATLEANKDVAENVPAIIVARIHRFEEVRRSLPVEQHPEYLLAITNRLKAATPKATIYIGQGHQVAWTMQEKDPALLREHLEGLRALFASPLAVGDTQVDVGITFGIDITPSPNVARRLAAAVAVAEKTTETFEPIAIADSASQEDLIWNISLQARMDAALSNGEIYLAFQPKIMVQTGEIVGAEALVRWNDPVKGHIPPDLFIRQCETAGRMSQLTRFVLEEACKAGNDFEAQGLHLPIAVNISATLLHERSIVAMVADVLDKSGFDPRRLTLEITETYRISNLDLAAEIIGELKALGTKISMDDFGVGAASLEALMKLPFSELKIDRMFIAAMTNDPKALGIVKSILQMGRDLRIIVVAEGVEDEGTLTLLRDSGCVVAQGFAISRPVRFAKLLENQAFRGNALGKNMV